MTGVDDGVRVRVERSGGFAGVVLRGEADTSQLDQTDPDRARRLRDLAGRVDFAALAASSRPGDAPPARGADRFCYSVEISADGESHSVQLGETAVPEELRPLLDHVLHPPR